ncbi:hydrolase [Pseudonocardia sulfidoxydans NBRC 16205]|uniref:Hydrolase n=1 Tax=Pseudonocardia sulfidoxydans NBRC 16205 TaxID=1223511 RepID=A0A511DLD7_9PSEU|nr:alpha/beta fold hydrolase [Pseudonocardia sulfidoxydans]GEL25083.1 hydrolase [Pseudonocardia sulfidoxydans NBRC 16205]
MSVAEAGVAFEVRGADNPTPLLFVPPLGRGRASWASQVAALEDSYRCVLFDPRGIGRSKDVACAGYSAATIADDARHVLDESGVEQAHVVGWSLGAAAAMLLALQHPGRVASLALLTPWARTDAHLARAFEMLRDLVVHASPESAEVATMWHILSREAVNAAGTHLLDGARSDVADPGYPAASTMVDYLDSGAELDVLDRLGDLAMPTLVVGGAEDRLVDTAHARATAAAIPGADLRVLTGPGATHALPVERADEVNALLRTFLTAHDTSVGAATT